MQHQLPVDRLGPDGPRMARAVTTCVHCGFCLPACPTYRVLGEEMDSPRGRILLMAQVLEGALPAEDAQPFIDRCLGCLGCETACPSGVRYRDLLEPYRERAAAQGTDGVVAGWRREVLLATLEVPARFRAAVQAGRLTRRLAALLPSSLADMLRLLPSQLPDPVVHPSVVPACGPRRGRVALVTGCVQDVLRPSTTTAAARRLAARGIEVVIPPDQGCCGALAHHVGETARAATRAHRHRAAFPSDIDAVVVTAAGCGSSMKAHPGGLAVPVVDIVEYLDVLDADAAPAQVSPAAAAPLRVAYHDACHLAHAQGIREAPRRLLARLPGVTLVPIADAEVCCGSAGLYNLEQPAVADALAARKAAAIRATGAAMVTTGNIGCLVQLQTALGADVEVLHTVELLDRLEGDLHLRTPETR